MVRLYGWFIIFVVNLSLSGGVLLCRFLGISEVVYIVISFLICVVVCNLLCIVGRIGIC